MNTKTSEIQGESVLIVGYGREGKSIHAWLTKHNPVVTIAIADTHKISGIGGAYIPGIKRYCGVDYLQHLGEYDTVIRSPGVSPYVPELLQYIKSGGHVTSATNIFFSCVKGKTIGVTGTKGKSTTASLIAHLLSIHYKDIRLVGNIGSPMLDALDSSTNNTVFVIELSSHQLADIRYSPYLAVLLGIVPEHLDYYPTFDAYRKAKENIFRFQKQGNHLLRCEKTAEQFTTNLLGNQENIAIAVRVARLMQIPEEMIRKQLKTFIPLPHRIESVGKYRDIRFYNDSLATIPEATIHALNALGSDTATLIAGGFDRGLDYTTLGKHVAFTNVKTLILFPDTGKKIWKATQAKQEIRNFDANSMEEAVRLAYAHTPKGKICLLSPASASFNMFRDYADRGEQFKAWVKKLA